MSVIDTATNTATNTVTKTIAVGTDPGAVALSPDGTHAYVTNFENGTVPVIDYAPSPAT